MKRAPGEIVPRKVRHNRSRMADEKTTRPGPDDAEAARKGRVAEAFNNLHQTLGDSLPHPARESLEKLRDAVAAQDAEQARRHLQDVKEKHGWLYTQLAEHPEVTALINELAIWGF
jgi:hypothetical protein